MPGGAFRSLANPNYRLWAAGALVSNVGTWMQRVAQDWLVLAQLTPHNATAVGVVTALQFGPQVLLLPWTGWAADNVDRRKLLLATQAALGALALGLGALTVTGTVALWHVYVFAGALGCVAAFDAPARQTFVGEVVGEAELSNAVALNAASFNAGRLLGPAAAGTLIAAVGTGWVFVINGLSYLGVIAALALMRTTGHRREGGPAPGGLGEGFRYLRTHAEPRTALLMLALLGTFGLNFPIFISTMALKVFKVDAQAFGLLTSAMAVGSVTGALLSARRERPTMRVLLVGSLVFGAGCALAAVAPTYGLFGAVLVLVGVSAQTLTTTANALVQLATTPEMRGRVIAILMATLMGGTPLGAPIVGWVADRFGPRWGLAIGAAAGFGAAIVAARHMRRREGYC